MLFRKTLITIKNKPLRANLIVFILLVLSSCSTFNNDRSKQNERVDLTTPIDVDKQSDRETEDANIDFQAPLDSAGKLYHGPSLVSPELLKSDLKQLVKLISAIHPEPFEILNQTDFDSKAASIYQSLQYPMSRSEFFVRLSPLIASMKDIHTRLNLPKRLQNKINFNNIFSDKKPSKLFPLAVLYEKAGLYVAADLSLSSAIPTGAEIRAINGAPVEFILSVMRRMTSFETEAGLRRRVQVNFPWLLAIMGYGKSDYEVDYVWNEQKLAKKVRGISPVATDTQLQNAANEDVDDSKVVAVKSFYGHSELTHQTSLLWFNDFNENPVIFEQFLENHFTKLASDGIHNLIIDVRYNDGGLSKNIRTFLHYLTSEPIYWNRLGEIKISQPLKNLHQERTKQRRINKYKWGLQWLPLEWTDYLQYEISWADIGEQVSVEFQPIEASGLPTPLKVVVLTNGYCFSACSSFVATINENDLGITIGEIPGSFARVQYGYPLKKTLEHSQLEITLPTMKLIYDESKQDRKNNMSESSSLITPKLIKTRSIEEIEQRKDSLLSEALSLIEN